MQNVSSEDSIQSSDSVNAWPYLNLRWAHMFQGMFYDVASHHWYVNYCLKKFWNVLK